MKKLFNSMAVLYFFAALTNLITGILAPAVYKEWADSALVPIYRSIMNQLSISTITFIMIFVFLYQMSMSLCFFYGRGKYIRIGLVMSIVFHIVIIPWGIWSLPNIIFVFLSTILLYKIMETN